MLPTARRRSERFGGAGVAEFLHDCCPGRSVGLFYEDDPEYWHEAVRFYSAPDKCYHILTPAGDEYVVDVVCLTITERADGLSETTPGQADGVAALDLDGIFCRFGEYPAVSDLQAKVFSLHASEGASVTVPSRVLPPSKAFMKWAPFTFGDEVAAGRARFRAKAIARPSTPRPPAPLDPMRVDVGTPDREREEQEPPEEVDPDDADVDRMQVTTEEVAGAIDAHTEVQMGSSDEVLGDKGLHKLASGEVAMEKVEPGSVPYIMHDLTGFVVELSCPLDQLAAINLASIGLVGRLYRLIEETQGTLDTDMPEQRKVPDRLREIRERRRRELRDAEAKKPFDPGQHIRGAARWALDARRARGSGAATASQAPAESMRSGPGESRRSIGDAGSDPGHETELLRQLRQAREERSLVEAGVGGGKGKEHGTRDPQHP